MFRRFFLKDKQKIIDDEVERLNEGLKSGELSSSLSKNVDSIRALFQDVDIFRFKYITNNHDGSLNYCIVYCDGVVDNAIINDSIIKPLMLSSVPVTGKDPVDTVMNQIVQINDTEKADKMLHIVESISYGDTALFIDKVPEAVVFNTKGFKTRAITEPESEKILTGPREGFTESLMMNLSLIRRKILSSELKMKFRTIGRRTRTRACICYIDGIVKKEVLGELYRRLDRIDIDAVLDTNYITELIRDSRWSPFRTTGYSERPDAVVGKLLEGRIAIFLDGTPEVLTVPYLFIENFQSSEDYYLNFFYSSFSRSLRILGFLLAIAIPGLYIAIVAFDQEMMPLQLFISITAERSSVPLPASLEAFIMIIVFDILRETGIRMPTNIGQALSIVGALVIGQAAVEAKLVAAPMIIVVAMTGITSLLVPKMNSPIIYLRMILLLLSSIFGFFGLILGSAVVLIHVINLRSLGIPQLSFSGELQFQEVKDTFIRAPWWLMLFRPNTAKDKVRLNDSGDRHV
ncbi:MAG: spore germination protein [Oscillospiraceae bacterium]|nr:spore germination protein [Oscillospiraceae bacterium]